MTADTLHFPVPSTLGSIDSYVQAIHRFPLLTADEEVELGRRLRDNGDVEAARKLVLSHLRLVVAVSRGYLGYGLPHADLIQEGSLGLMKAVKRFDPDRGVRLVSFAIYWIKAEIHEFIIRNWRLVKVATTKAQRKLFFNLRSLKKDLGSMSQADVESVANTLKVQQADVREMETRLYSHDIALEAQSDDEDAAFAPIAYLTAQGAEPTQQLERQAHERLLNEGLQGALATLDPRSRHIVESRWLNEENPATLHDLAALYNISAERVRQIEVKAMQKMRVALGNG